MPLSPIEAAVLLIAVLNCFVTIWVAFAHGNTVGQKLLQILVVWLLPVLGGILVYLFHRTDSETRGPGEPPFGGGANDGMPGGVQ